MHGQMRQFVVRFVPEQLSTKIKFHHRINEWGLQNVVFFIRAVYQSCLSELFIRAVYRSKYLKRRIKYSYGHPGSFTLLL